MGIPDYIYVQRQVRFAKDILVKMHTVTTNLERILGPDTGDLGLRIGIHSGPGEYTGSPQLATVIKHNLTHKKLNHTLVTVTAGVLRGERSRFQLFGDTMK